MHFIIHPCSENFRKSKPPSLQHFKLILCVLSSSNSDASLTLFGTVSLAAMDELACPRCRTTKYRNPSLRLMVNVCGHALCDNCVELLFVKGSGACPQCNVPLRRGQCLTFTFTIVAVVRHNYAKREEIPIPSLLFYNFGIQLYILVVT